MTDKHTEFLRENAIKRVWCAPDMDHNFTFTLPRVGSPSGSLAMVSITGIIVDLPDQYSRWQVFQIGGIPPSAFNLLTQEMKWISAIEQANERKTSMRLFDNYGVCAGLADIFYRYTLTGNLLIAVKQTARTPINWSNSTFHLHLYSNAFWNTEDGLTDPTGFEAGGMYIDKSADIGTFNAQYNAAAAKAQGAIQMSFWKNGVRVDKATASITVGDTVWFELDGSIKRRYTFPLQGLASFDSTLDKVRKFLLHPPKAEDDDKTIDFIDELEIFITAPNSAKTSLRFARLRAEHLRQLTHRDYSIAVQALVFQGSALSEITGLTFDKFSLQVSVKNGGWPRPLVFEGSYIQEMYKMNEFDINRCLTGIDATVPFWRAAELEASQYPAIMRADGVCDITYPMVESAYGYYAMAKALAITPSEVLSPGNNGYVIVPYLLMWGCTAYEYDENGLFLGWAQHYRGLNYFVKNELCRKVELIPGMGGKTLDELHGVTTAKLRTDCNWKVYLRRSIGGQVQPEFTDVTGSNRYTLDAEGNFTWLNPTITDYVTVRSDRRFYSADYEVDLLEGRIAVNITTMQTHGDKTSLATIVIPLGQHDVMFNGRSLIRGLHYYYEKGQIVITARDYVNQAPGAKQKVHVRAMGFCQKDGQLYPEGDWGFVQHGVLSNNGRFDVRDGRIVRMVVNGELRLMDEFIFSENSNQIAPIDPINGQCYLIKDILIPLKPFAEPDTWTLIAKARERTKIVEDYLTLKIPQPSRGPVVAIPRTNLVFSPFLAKLLYDLLYGRIGLPNKPSFNRQDVIEICKSYEPLLKTDPLQKGLDRNFVTIVPHTKVNPIAVSPRQFQFLSQVVKYYADGLVDLTGSLSISS